MIAAAWYLAFQLRFDFEVPPWYERMLRETLWLVLAIKLVVFVAFGFYQRWWRYVSTRDMWRALLGVGVGSVITVVAVYFFYPVEQFRRPRGARQGGAHRRRRRRRPVDPPRAAALEGARVHPDRARRRRPPQARHAPARRARPRADVEPPDDSAEQSPGRGPDRDSVRTRRDAPARRRDRARRERSREDATRALRTAPGRPRAWEADPPGAGRGPPRPRARRGRLRRDHVLPAGTNGRRDGRGRVDRL